MNQQREVIYGYRKQILGQVGLRDMVKEFSQEAATELVAAHVDEKAHPEDWNLKAIGDAATAQFGVPVGAEDMSGVNSREALAEAIAGKAWNSYQEKINLVGDEPFLQFEKVIMLHTLDTLWKDHLLSMDHLKGGIGLRGYGQKNPLQEYKKEGFEMFVGLIGRLRSEVCERLFKVQIKRGDEAQGQESAPPPPQQTQRAQKVRYSRGEEEEPEKEQPVTRVGDKVGRNDPCPCGSGLKYKRCCGATAAR